MQNRESSSLKQDDCVGGSRRLEGDNAEMHTRVRVKAVVKALVSNEAIKLLNLKHRYRGSRCLQVGDGESCDSWDLEGDGQR